jgi:hypothetical protein
MTGPGDAGGVSIAVQGGQIAIANHTGRPVFISVENPLVLASSNSIPCVNAPRCWQLLADGATRLVPAPTNPDGSPAQSVIVSWWHAVAWPAGALRHSGGQSVVVPL